MTRLEPLLPVAVTDLLAQAVRTHFTAASVTSALGLPGQAALSRADLSGADRLTRGGTETETLIRLFLLGLPVSEQAAAAALRPLPLPTALAVGLIEHATADCPAVRAALGLRPHSEDGGPDWWVLSDLGSDLRPGPVSSEHVLGIGTAATTLAQATVRRPVSRALDVGTGCGVQALHLSRHCAQITATDVSERALAFAASTAELNEQHWQLRHGSLLEPVADEAFDLIACNPPFIVGPGFTPAADGFSYRDSGLPGDGLCARLVAELPARLAPGGTGQLLANWAITADQPWQERVSGWLPPEGCDAWIWQREVAEPGEYVAMWLRDAGEQPGTDGWRSRYDRWLDWFAANRVLGIGLGLLNIRRTGQSRSSVVCEDVPQPHEIPVGAAIADWFDRRRWLESADLLAARVTAAPDLVLEQRSLLAAAGWQPALSVLRQAHGLRWELEVDQAVAALVAGTSAGLPLAAMLELIAASIGQPAPAVTDALLPVVRDLVERGFLLPPVVS